jgi:hypothetical protein
LSASNESYFKELLFGTMTNFDLRSLARRAQTYTMADEEKDVRTDFRFAPPSFWSGLPALSTFGVNLTAMI